MLNCIPEFDQNGIRSAWSHFMAVFAGRHIFPDANHRTALTLFNLGIWLEFGAMTVPGPEIGESMTKESKAMRDEFKLRTGPYYKPEDLGPDHPYRRIFAKYESGLKLLLEADIMKGIIEAEAEAARLLAHPQLSPAQREENQKMREDLKIMRAELAAISSAKLRKQWGLPGRAPSPQTPF
ncbi:MAG: hypothetical protein HYT80_06120 [Euryarchaeota archaeon]|nr:hypothetical protein [Euryarchaeota archaeon]